MTGKAAAKDTVREREYEPVVEEWGWFGEIRAQRYDTHPRSIHDLLSLPPRKWPGIAGPWENASAAVVEEEKAALLTFLRAEKIGSKTATRIAEHFGGARAALSADDSTLQAVAELTPETLVTVRNAESEGFGKKQLELANRIGARVLLPGEAEYPRLLALSSGPPAVLFALGLPLPSHTNAIAVVGTRYPGEAGTEIAHQIGAGLSLAGISVVSGMARGIDAAAHRGALSEHGGHTVAVLGCGVDTAYPPQNRKLYNSILREGTVVSELFLGAGPEPRNFPMRNRILAWMSVATVVVEAARKSGSLITAAYALQENREVFSIPGHPLSKNHEGSNHLLKQGATFARHAGDILEVVAPLLGLAEPSREQTLLSLDAIPKGMSDEEKRVWLALDPVEKMHSDRVAAKVELDASRLGVILLQMELKGWVRRLPGEHYLRVVSRSGGSN